MYNLNSYFSFLYLLNGFCHPSGVGQHVTTPMSTGHRGRGVSHVVLIVQRHHFAYYLEREWQCLTYDIQAANVLVRAYDKTRTMTTNQMAVEKLIAWSLRPIILLKFRVDGITYNPLDGEILNWPTGQMDSNLQMIAKKWSEFERRIATLEFDNDKKSTGVIVTSVSGEESLLMKGAVENLLEKSTKIQLLDGTVVPLDDSSRNYIVPALHEMSTSALKPLNDAPVLKLADIGVAMGISEIENMTITRECAASFKQVSTSKFFSLVDKANFQGRSIVMTQVITEVLCFITVRNC